MARVWFVFDGPGQTGEAFTECAASQCVDKLQLERSQRRLLCKDEAPKSMELRDRLREPKRVVVEIFDGEDPIWQAGFYDAPISPDQARIALLD